MELTNEFTLPVPPERAWAVLGDADRVVACLPGARLDRADSAHVRGELTLRVGPLAPTYRGTMRMVEHDPLAGRVVLRAEGDDTRQGRAIAVVTAVLSPSDGWTHVHLTTDLTVEAKVAQFGGSVLADLSAAFVAQFAERLRVDLAPEAVPSTPPAPAPAVRGVDAALTDAVPGDAVLADAVLADRRGQAGALTARRLLPLAMAAAGTVVAVALWHRRRR